MTRAAACLVALLFGLSLNIAIAQVPPPAGEIALLTGRGTVTGPDGGVRDLAKGDKVFSGEIVNSGPNSYVNIKFTDGGFTMLRPTTRFEIEEYAFDSASPAPTPAPGTPATQAAPAPPIAAPASPPSPAPILRTQATTSKAFFRLLKGGFRAVTGLVGKINRDDYRVRTPVATIGIRGTDYTVIDCDAACQADPVVFAAMQNIPAGSIPAGATFTITIVHSGEVTISNPVTGTAFNAPAGTVVLSIPNNEPIVLDQPPAFIQQDPVPPPDACGA